MMMF
ncbi:BgTH12-06866 [Blumeria graminis f. sp. triticale]